MNESLRIWFGQATTGHGFMIIAPVMLSALAGTISWATAAPLLVAGAIGLVWPENPALRSAGQTLTGDIEKMMAAFANTGANTGTNMVSPGGSIPPV